MSQVDLVGFVKFSRPALLWLVEPAFSLEPHSRLRWGLLSAASLLARLFLVVYRAREKVSAYLGRFRGERATHTDNEGL
jgi:hypothetical protein